jgi:hypothetical protein
MFSNTRAGARAAVITPTTRFELAVHARMPTIFAVVALCLHVCARISSLE